MGKYFMLKYAVVDRNPDTGWGTAVFFERARETMRHVNGRLSGELNFVIYDLDKEDRLGLGELVAKAQEDILDDINQNIT